MLFKITGRLVIMIVASSATNKEQMANVTINSSSCIVGAQSSTDLAVIVSLIGRRFGRESNGAGFSVAIEMIEQ